jgi:hypothetical protein
MISDKMQVFIFDVIILCLAYWVVSMFFFEVRNPKANGIRALIEFKHVITWQKIERYQ